jgi:WXG100 family type VII secretion target
MQLEATANTAQYLSQQADDLGKELADIARSWGELAAKWTGKARSAYQPVWEEWHTDAHTVVAILAEHSALLIKSVSLLAENEAQAAGANGKTIDVTFAFIRNNDGVVRLVTAIPASK